MKKLLKGIACTVLSATMLLATVQPTITGAADDLKNYGTISITEYSPWFESAYIEWSELSGATGYNAYYKEAGTSDFVKADDELVRKVDGGYRVDYLGLKKNTTFDLKIVPVVNGSEDESQSASVTITTMAYDRSGFAFAKESVTGGKASGGYNDDGTVPADAQIFYITEATKGTVTDETAIAQGKPVGLDGLLESRMSKNHPQNPLIVRFVGHVTNPPDVEQMFDIMRTKNVTFEGVGEDAYIEDWGINIRESQNIEVRNLNFYGFPDDAVGIQVENKNCFIHNNNFHIGKDMGGDKTTGDGSVDIKKKSDWITVSYNHFIKSGKACLCGLSGEDEYHVTYHHNYYQNAGSRGPRVRIGKVHVYNNYYYGMTSYCIGATLNSRVLSEGNYFEQCVRPYVQASRGHDNKLWPNKGESLLSGEGPGKIKPVNDYLDEKSLSWVCDEDTDTTDFNFDPATFYTYTASSPQQAKADCMAYAGTIKYVASSGTQEPTTQTTTQKIETTETTTQNVDVNYGDVNEDGSITASDAANILAYVLNSDEMGFSSNQIKSADVNSDSSITASDAATVLAKVLNNDYIF